MINIFIGPKNNGMAIQKEEKPTIIKALESKNAEKIKTLAEELNLGYMWLNTSNICIYRDGPHKNNFKDCNTEAVSVKDESQIIRLITQNIKAL